MRYYPAFLDLAGRHCLVAGAGEVGCRKIETLLKCGPASLTVVDILPPETAQRGAFSDLMRDARVVYTDKPFADEDLDGIFLAVAATGERALNERIARACRERGVLCNVVDAPDEGSFIVPAHLESGEVVLALSTGGSPALTRRIKRDLQDALASRYDGLATVMARLRPLVLALGRPTGENTALFRAVVDSDLIEALHARDAHGARALLEELLPPSLVSAIDEVLDGLC